VRPIYKCVCNWASASGTR